MKDTNMSIFAISLIKEGQLNVMIKTATSVERHLYNLAGCRIAPWFPSAFMEA
jgi:hypothetical protein